MRGLRVTASFRTLAWAVTSRWLRTAWLRWIQDRSSAITRNLLEHRFPAGIAGTLMTELWACVSSAFQRSATHAGTDMLRFDILISRAEMRPQLTACSLALIRPLLSSTAPLSACVSTAVQSSFALAWAHGRLNHSLVAECLVISTTALTLDVHLAETRTTWSNVTQFLTRMTTSKSLATWLLAAQNWILAGDSRRVSRNLR
jgi:hypothetical protein